MGLKTIFPHVLFVQFNPKKKTNVSKAPSFQPISGITLVPRPFQHMSIE
jgi:hypothetical protein